ncbi:dual specificity protein kinase shkB-like [Actinia tenebrosa]|uniref:Dual specificity protein kinase shkB-like n=1 Tax=Actinia tenebrosa TaxID=6105 RepID=A0A6P8ISZ4_ACTTE|nr:dual specificity protein kinase shkB-like [Actinia tenebrosa]
MSRLGSESTKYILLKHKMFNLEMQCEVFQRGQIFVEDLDVPYSPSGFITLNDKSRGVKFQCPAEDTARLTYEDAENLMRIVSLENRYKAFKEGSRFKNLEAGSKVFVEVNGREFPGVVKVVSQSCIYSEPMVEVEIEEYSSIVMTSERTMLRQSSNGNIVVNVSFDKLRSRYESRRNPPAWEERLLEALVEQKYNAHSLEKRLISLEETLAVQHQAYENVRECLRVLTQLDLKEKEKDLANSEQISDEFEKELTIEQKINKELELKLNELQRKLASEQEAKKEADHRFELSKQRVQELEVTLAEERHGHEQTKKNVKESSEKIDKLNINLTSTVKALEEKEKHLIRIRQISAAFEKKLVTEQETAKEVEKHHQRNEDKSNELQRKLAYEQKAREEADKRLEICQKTSKELETTLAETQKLVKKRQEPDNECEWILNREEIQLTEEKLGSGTFGTVCKGIFRGTPVAVKQVSVKPRITEYNIENFRREMKMASRCRHPCMLQFIGATSDDQSLLLLTELLDTSLKAVLLDRALNLVEIITIAMDVAKGLNYLHLTRPHPIVHRDISSGNVLLWKHGQSWRGKISDYGNAVLMNYAKTGSGGAISYLAPEMNNKRFSPKSDVYSFGVLLLEMCLREEPSCLDDRDELICLVEDGELRSLIRSCLQQEPTQRPSMDKVLDVLTDQLSNYYITFIFLCFYCYAMVEANVGTVN